jgi:hypothetical protein
MTVPLPLLLDPEVTVIQLAASDALHVQPPGAVTPALPLPADALKDPLLAERV